MDQFGYKEWITLKDIYFFLALKLFLFLFFLAIGTVNLSTQTLSVTEGDTITLSCSVTNRYPLPQYFSWFKNNDLLAAVGRISISSPNTATSQLVIQDTLTGDAGSYSCRVPAVHPLLPSLTDSISVTVTGM